LEMSVPCRCPGGLEGGGALVHSGEMKPRKAEIGHGHRHVFWGMD